MKLLESVSQVKGTRDGYLGGNLIQASVLDSLTWVAKVEKNLLVRSLTRVGKPRFLVRISHPHIDILSDRLPQDLEVNILLCGSSV